MSATTLRDAPRLLHRTPLAGNYPAAVAMALLALSPFIVLSTASLLVEQDVVRDLGTSRFGSQLASGLANAGYAFGAVAAADLIKRVSGRTLYLACEALFVVGSLLGTFAPEIATFTVGRVLQGVATGMLLVAALPPLVTNHGVDKLPLTAAYINLGLFGMVTLGPTVGGLAGSFHAWRLLFGIVAVFGFGGLVVGLLAFARGDAPSPRMGFDFSAIPVAAMATVLPFLAVSWLSRASFTSLGFLLPLVLGLLALGFLVVRQYRKTDALMPVKLIAHTLPVTGIGAAMVAGAGFTTLVELAAVYLLDAEHQPPLLIGGLLATQVLGVAVAAWLFKRVLPTRWLPVLAFGGLLVVVAGGAVLLALGPGHGFVVVAVAGLLLGFGAGAGVAPGLFMGGLSAPSSKLGPTFALVELLRSEAAFLIGPVLLQIAMVIRPLASGVRLASLTIVVIGAASAVLLVGLLLLGGRRPHAPDLQTWLDGDEPAYDSPRLAAVLRSSHAGPRR